MNSRASYKLMLLVVNLLEFVSSDAKCSVFDGMILGVLTDEKNLGSEKTGFPYRKPTQVGRSSRPR